MPLVGRPKQAFTVQSLKYPWSCISSNESQDQNLNTGNGFYGYFQFSLQSWNGIGMKGYPNQYPLKVQLNAAKKLEALQGWQSAFPNSSAECGL